MHASASREQAPLVRVRVNPEPNPNPNHCTLCSPLNRGDEGAAFGLINVREESLEVVGPCVDDLLPTLKRGEPTGRPESVPCAGGAEAQAVTLELPPRRSVSVNSKSERLARARL